jgi:hypothetical protein
MQITINNQEDAKKASKFLKGLEAKYIQKMSVLTGYEGKQGLTGKFDIEIEIEYSDFENPKVPLEQSIKAKFYDAKDMQFDFQEFYCPAENPESIWVQFDIDFRQEKERFLFILKKPPIVDWRPNEHALFSFSKAEIGEF